MLCSRRNEALYHIYHEYACPTCGRYYCRFAAEQVCPYCGDDTAPVFELVAQIFDYARATLVAAGAISLDGYRPVTSADHYLMLGFELLDAYRRHVELPPELVADEAVRQYTAQCGHREALEAHWRSFFTALLEYWRDHRNQPL